MGNELEWNEMRCVCADVVFDMFFFFWFCSQNIRKKKENNQEWVRVRSAITFGISSSFHLYLLYMFSFFSSVRVVRPWWDSWSNKSMQCNAPIQKKSRSQSTHMSIFVYLSFGSGELCLFWHCCFIIGFGFRRRSISLINNDSGELIQNKPSLHAFTCL